MMAAITTGHVKMKKVGIHVILHVLWQIQDWAFTPLQFTLAKLSWHQFKHNDQFAFGIPWKFKPFIKSTVY